MNLRTVVRRMLRGRTEGSVQPLRRRRLTSVLATIVWLQVCLLLGLHTPSRFLPHTGIQLWMTPMVEHIVSLRQSASRSGRELALRCKAPDVQLRTTTGRNVQLADFRGRKTVLVFVDDGAG